MKTSRRSWPWVLSFLGVTAIGLLWRGQELDDRKAALLAEAAEAEREAMEAARGWSAPVSAAPCRFSLAPQDVEGGSAGCFDLAIPAPGEGGSARAAVHGVELDGDRDGVPVFVLNGGPGWGEAVDLSSRGPATRRLRFGDRPVVHLGPRSAEDVVAAAEGLGHETFFVAAGGYASRLAVEVWRRHGDRLAGVFLESVVPPDLAPRQLVPTGVEAAVTELFGRCRADPRCPVSDPDAALERAVRRLAEAPLDTRFGSVDAAGLGGALMSALDQQDLLGFVPRGLDAIAEGRTSTAARFLSAALRRRGAPGAQPRAVPCPRFESPLDRADFARRWGRLRPSLQVALRPLKEQLTRCGPVASGAPRAPPPPEALPAVPVLVLAPTLDGRMPPEGADRLRAWAGLRAERVLRLPGRTHRPALGGPHAGAFVDACAARLLRRFLEDPGPLPGAPECVQAPPIVFR